MVDEFNQARASPLSGQCVGRGGGVAAGAAGPQGGGWCRLGRRGEEGQRRDAGAGGDEGAQQRDAAGAGGHQGGSGSAAGDALPSASASGRGHGAGAVRGPALPCRRHRLPVLGLVSWGLVDGPSYSYCIRMRSAHHHDDCGWEHCQILLCQDG